MSILYSNASITHTYGNVACLAMDYVTKYFDDNFFKKTHISTKLAHRQLDIYRTKIEFWKLKKPILLMRPRIDLDDSSKYFYGSAMMNRMFNVESPMEYANITDIMVDKHDKGSKIGILWNRCKIYYDVVLILDTFNSQLNVSNYLLNMMVPNTPFFIKTSLESYIPKPLMSALADHLKVDMNDTASILHYLNTYGEIPFTYKFKDGSGTDEFFALYDTNVEMIVSDISIDDGSTKGLVTENYTISFTLSCEFNAMGCFYLFLVDEDSNFRISPPEAEDNSVSTNIFTMPLMYDMKLEPGWKLFSAPSFFVKGEVDTVNIGAVFTENVITVLNYQKGMNLSRDTFIKFRVFRHRHELIYGEDFEVDSEDSANTILTVRNCNPKATYRIFIILNMELINSMVAEMSKFNESR